MGRQSAVWIVLGALAGGALGFGIGWALAADDLSQLGDWRHGSERFVGFGAAAGLALGALVTARITRGKAMARDGFTLSYRIIEPTATGYREVVTPTVGALLTGLRRIGSSPEAAACDDTGAPRGPIDVTTPLAGANVAIREPRVRGVIRIHLVTPPAGAARAMGLVEMWSERGDSTEELGLFTLKVLGELVDDLTASRETSQLGQDPVALLTAGLGARPKSVT
jgi:hypothetical protein